MPGPASTLTAAQRRAAVARPHLIHLSGEWVLWRDLAVRSAGFPVSGLDVFGSQEERAGLRAVASDPLFREAVTWQNRAAMRNAIGKVAAGSPAGGSDQRRREEVVASYWQRYCAKNDTIGFFGPLAWGRLADDGPAIQARCGRLVSKRTVHFEAWAMQAHGPRITISRTVWRRERWDIPAAQGPPHPEAAASWARDHGMPRRVFALSPSETKPIYVDFDSPILTRILCRQIRRAAAEDPSRPVRFTEMLPAPEDCWLADEHGRRYTSELRLIAVDLRCQGSQQSNHASRRWRAT